MPAAVMPSTTDRTAECRERRLIAAVKKGTLGFGGQRPEVGQACGAARSTTAKTPEAWLAFASAGQSVDTSRRIDMSVEPLSPGGLLSKNAQVDSNCDCTQHDDQL
jgi:hypothetical protein